VAQVEISTRPRLHKHQNVFKIKEIMIIRTKQRQKY